MEVYRTCGLPEKSINVFLDSAAEIAAVAYLNPVSMIDEVFARPPSDEYWSRFCPRSSSRNPLYASESSRTTFFEYGFHLLRRTSSFEGHFLSIGLYSFHLLEPLPGIIDLTIQVPAGVLDSDDPEYIEAHKFLASLRPFPPAIRYPSVRSADPGICYAVFEKTAILATVPTVKVYQIKPLAERKLQLVDPETNSVDILNFA